MQERVPEQEWSLWCEQRLMLTIVTHILLEPLTLTNLRENIHQIATLCANSKRRRLPALYRLLVPKRLFSISKIRANRYKKVKKEGKTNEKLYAVHQIASLTFILVLLGKY